MREFQGKRRWRRLVYSLPVLVLLVLLIILLTNSAYRLYDKRQLANRERQLALTEVVQLRARQAELTETVAKLNTARGVEAAIRENFNVVKPGEKVITLVAGATTTVSSNVEPAPIPWWQPIINWFSQT
ncbi:MAG TPA: septum formation initiator family protein [Candidatus Paceibacterota bacterium]